MKVDRVDVLVNTGDLGSKFLDAARRKEPSGMLPVREHERRLERMVDGRSAKDVWRRWRGSCFEGMRYHAFAVPLETAAGMAAGA